MKLHLSSFLQKILIVGFLASLGACSSINALVSPSSPTPSKTVTGSTQPSDTVEPIPNVQPLSSNGISPTTVKEIHVAVPCNVPTINKPKWALSNLSPSADDMQFFRAALAELEQRKNYESQLEAALNQCRGY